MNSSGAVLATNSWGPSGLLSRRSASSSTFYSFDAQGNVAQRLSSTGSVLSSHGFDAYGAENSTTSVTDPYAGYGGRHGGYTDPETGLTLFSNRYYDPTVGRWINRDPIGYAGGINVYSYCLNNPGNNSDPSGLICCDDDDGGPQYDNCYLSDFQSGAHPGFAGAVGAVKAAANLMPGVQAGSALTGKDVFGCNISPMERLGDAVGTALSMIPGGEEAGEGIGGLATEEGGAAETAANGPCFVAGTPIEVAEPAQKTIEQLKPGDIVSSQGLTSGDKTTRSQRTRLREFPDGRRLEVMSVKSKGRIVTVTLKDMATSAVFAVVRPADAAISLCETDPSTTALSKCEISAHGLDAGRDKLETRSIETIVPGMKVASRNPTTGKTEFRTVVRTFKHTVNETIRLELADKATGPTVDTLRGTPQHPFFTSNGVVPMGELHSGMKLLDRYGSETVVKHVEREKHPKGIAVYNFEVEGDHTYFIGRAEGGAWVHNECTDIAANLVAEKGEGSIIRVWNPNGQQMENGMWLHDVYLGTDGNVIDPMRPQASGLPFDDWVNTWEWGDGYGYEYLDPGETTNRTMRRLFR